MNKAFRFNNRKDMEDSERASALTYTELIGKEEETEAF
jgi:hypothetical protein